MKNQQNSSINQNTRLMGILLGAASLLLIPLVAMQFTKEVSWTLSDFIIAGSLLISTGLAIELVLRTVKSRNARFVFCAIILFILFIIWAELAVGIFGTPFAGS